MKRRSLVVATTAALGVAPVVHALAAGDDAPPANGRRVLRVAMPAAETSFDPAVISDLYSATITAHLFESLYRYDHLARPFQLRPRTAVALPEASDDYRSWTVRLTPGILFSDDPAFGGKPRELTAADYVYSFKRFFDPAVKSPSYPALKDLGLLGLEALRERALRDKQPFDYDREVEGLRATDRYTLQFRLAEPRPRLVYTLAESGQFGAVAREVVEAAGDGIGARPVGTGPFVLAQWRRGSLIVLERNPRFRDLRYDERPAPGDAQGEAIRARLAGRRLPLVDRVEVAVVEEAQPRWLAFLNGQFDMVAVPPEYATQSVPGGVLAPNLAKRGIQMERVVASDVTMTLFNMEDPTVGGYAPAQVALRRAIGLATDVPREIELARRGQAVPAQASIVPGTYGYDPTFKSENGEHDPARAKALLDLFGYVDRNGDGWRERPDGSPLVLTLPSTADQTTRQLNELWKKSMDAVGLKSELRIGQFGEQLKAARAGKLMLWRVGSTANSPDGQDALQRVYGPAAGGQNLARFRLPALDAIYQRMTVLPDGPERLALFAEANKLIVAYMPYKLHVHRVLTDLMQPWLVGWRRPLFWRDGWQYVDLVNAPA